MEGTEESPDRCRARGQDGPRRGNGECCLYLTCRATYATMVAIRIRTSKDKDKDKDVGSLRSNVETNDTST